ncbi:hypothetical protein HMPREF9123_2114 [Neisseria bacilliformis ATCC BAA-1200]|uniref:Uncharacterized protein n=1 Tax=Neisseria bacilliformis ATCC BAA-1200 TaxID=888742 RepID=F2BEF8_9NEIS|nr:hypothetical protein HMPREF9123_2114 [Neisseria bacilliformis ATCC BAA-1200]
MECAILTFPAGRRNTMRPSEKRVSAAPKLRFQTASMPRCCFN